MKLLLAAGAAMALNASATTTQTTISIHPGEMIVLRFDNGTAVVEQSGRAQPMTKFETYVLWRAQTQDVPPGVATMPPGFVREGEGAPDPPHPSDNRLRISMRLVPALQPGQGDNAVLTLSNGYGSTVRYHVLMHSGARSAATDVCDVPPHLSGLEHWPYSLDQLDLSDVKLVESDSTVSCQ